MWRFATYSLYVCAVETNLQTLSSSLQSINYMQLLLHKHTLTITYVRVYCILHYTACVVSLTDANMSTLSFILASPNLVIPSTSPLKVIKSARSITWRWSILIPWFSHGVHNLIDDDPPTWQEEQCTAIGETHAHTHARTHAHTHTHTHTDEEICRYR